jgi:hypothetical protein
MKIRLTQSFKDAISEARRVFGVDNNYMKDIVKRALITYAFNPFDYSKPHDKGGNPTTINIDFRTKKMDEFVRKLKSKEIQGIVIAFCNNKIEKNASRRQSPPKLDKYTGPTINEVINDMEL